VRIKVVRPKKLVWDMNKDACLARWSSAAWLAWPAGHEREHADRFHQPLPSRLENGSTDNEPAIVMHPDASAKEPSRAFSGLQGQGRRPFPGSNRVPLRNKKCKVAFQLSYRNRMARCGPDSWNEKYDGKIQKIDVDLSKLAGKEVELILTVFSRGDSTDDRAFWLLPGIWR
jgi:hypothetical protein